MELLKQLYRISSPSGQEKRMRKYILKYCKKLGAETQVDSKGNVYVTKGVAESYPCIVAHMDEVCPERGQGYKVIEDDGVIMGFDLNKREFSGIGGDDKNGIWVALKCLEKYEQIKCAFFVEEEIGCGGSEVADMNFFLDCRYVLQCDRRGNSDLITNVYFTDLCSDEFLAATNYKDFGYKEQSGMLTDVYTLKENGLQVSCLNISCGYYNPHSENEYTIFSDLENCLHFVENIIENCLDVYPHKCTPSSQSYYGHSKYGYFNKYYSQRYNQWDDYTNNDKENNEVELSEDEYEEYTAEYNDMEQIIADDYEFIQSIPNGEESIAASQLIEDYGFKYLSVSEVVELINYYR